MPRRAESAQPRADLGELLTRPLPRLLEMEAPILADVGLSMWEYSILSTLGAEGPLSQSELSARTRRDPTRLGHHLRDLAVRGLVARDRSSDQRRRVARLTDTGSDCLAETKRRIHAAEDALLESSFTRTEAEQLRALLARLAVA